MAVELATAYVSIVPSTRGIKGQLQDQLSGPIGEAGRREGGRFGGALAGAASKALKAGVAGAVGGFGAAIFKGFTRLRDIDDATFKLQGLGHDAATVETIMQSALDAVKGTAFGLGEAATIAAGAVAAGIDPGEELTRVLSLTGDAASIAGVGLDEMGSIFGKVAASNRMMTEEMNQLQDRGLPVLSWLQDELGATAEDVREMVSSGEVDFATFTRIIEDNIGGAALTAGESFRGSLANTGAAIGRLGAALLGPAFERAPEFLAGITAGVDRLTEAAGPAIERIGTIARGLFDLVARGDFTGDLGRALGLHEDAPLFNTILTIRSAVIGAFETIRGAFETFRDSVLSGEMSGRLASLRETFASVWSSISTIVRGAFDIIRSIIGPQLLVMKALWDQFGTGILAAVSFAFDHIVNIVQTVMGVVAGVVDVVAGILTGDWSRAWEGARGIVISVVQGVHRTVLSFWSAFGGIITRNINALVGWFQALPGRIADGLRALPGLVGFILGRMTRLAIETTRAMVTGIIDFVGSLPGRIAGFFRDVVARIREAASSWRSEGASAGQGVLDSIGDRLRQLPSLVRAMIGNAISAIGDMARRAFNAAQEVASGLWSGFKAGLGISSPSFIEDAMTAIAGNVLSQTDALAGQVGRMHRLASGIPSMAPVTPSIRVPQVVRGGDGAFAPGAMSGATINIENINNPKQEPVSRLPTQLNAEIWLAGG